MKSVRIKHALGKTAGLKQREAQKDRIPDTSPHGARFLPTAFLYSVFCRADEPGNSV